MKNIQDPVHRLRMLTEMTMIEFAEAVGVSYMTVYRWENRNQAISLSNQLRLHKLVIFYYISIFKRQHIENDKILDMCRGALNSEFGDASFANKANFTSDTIMMREFEQLNT